MDDEWPRCHGCNDNMEKWIITEEYSICNDCLKYFCGSCEQQQERQHENQGDEIPEDTREPEFMCDACYNTLESYRLVSQQEAKRLSVLFSKNKKH